MAPQELTLDAEVFDEFRRTLNAAIRSTISQMIETKTNGGTVTAKVEIKLDSKVDEETGEIYYIPDIEPGVSTKLGKKTGERLKKLDRFYMRQTATGGYIVGTRQIEIKELFAEAERA